jgi:Domain of unknown function (DUF4340)
MNSRNFTILVVVAAVLAVLAFFGLSRNDTKSIAGGSAGTLLLPDLAAHLDDVNQVLVDGAGGKRLATLQSANGAWTVDERDGYSADAKKVGALLIALSETKIVEEKTANPDFYSRLGVEPIDTPEATGLELTLVEGDSRSSVVIGNTYGSSERYARIADHDQSVLVDHNPDVPRDAKDWVQKQIISVASKRIQRVRITHADGEELVLSKGSPNETNFTVEDIPEGRELQYAGIGNVTGTVLQDLNLDDVARQGEAAAKPDVVSRFSTFDGLIVTVSATAAEGEDPWLTFSAEFDPEQAAAYAPSPAADQPDAGAADADTKNADTAPSDAAKPDAEKSAAEKPDIAAEAAAINARVSGWKYRIPSYQYSQLARRMDNLLKAPPAADK